MDSFIFIYIVYFSECQSFGLAYRAERMASRHFRARRERKSPTLRGVFRNTRRETCNSQTEHIERHSRGDLGELRGCDQDAYTQKSFRSRFPNPRESRSYALSKNSRHRPQDFSEATCLHPIARTGSEWGRSFRNCYRRS